jgi:ribosomal protein L20A (L18A)
MKDGEKERQTIKTNAKLGVRHKLGRSRIKINS